MAPIVVNVRKAELIKRDYIDIDDWLSNPWHLYIGRHNHYVGVTGSKWRNPYSVKKYGLKKSLQMYEKYILETMTKKDFKELKKYSELGCWCKPNACHGDILLKILQDL